jgi:RimJ/RimL family protein N-acetyltransferase
MTLDIPTIETENLILRGPCLEDMDAFADFMRSPRSHLVGGPKSRHETWRGLASMLGHWVLRGHGFWHIVEKSTGKSVGNCGHINHEGWDEPELGWHVFDGFEGRGYAFEAATAAREYAARHMGLDGVISYIEPENTLSLNLAKRLGAVFERDGHVIDIPCHIYRHPKLEALI